MVDRDDPPVVCHHPALREVVSQRLDERALGRVRALLSQWGTLEIERLDNGLVSAVPGGGANRVSGYDAVWLRDTVHVAHALWRTEGAASAIAILEPLLRFQTAHVHRFEAVIDGRVHHDDLQQRPHVRFDGRTLRERPERWAHAQNDALAYVAWLAASLWREGAWSPTAEQIGLLARTAEYFAAIDYTNDRDSGHWEEERRVHASSVGTVVAALEALASAARKAGTHLPGLRRELTPVALEDLARAGRSRLAKHLPYESPQDSLSARDADAAVLFLVRPLDVLDDEAADEVVESVLRELLGPYGIKRYGGDSYWGADYRDLFAPQVRSTDYSTTTAQRDATLKPGTEAQWCIFDPVLSVHFARRHARTGDEVMRARADLHLRRSLGQITGEGEWCAAGLAPEAYFLASSTEGVYRPNDQTPLAWTQANLMWALAEFDAMLRA